MAWLHNLLLTFLLLCAFSSASCLRRNNATPSLPLNEVAAQNTGTPPIPKPTTSPTAILLGIGYQNYTCNATPTSNGVYIQTGPSDGALAELFDISNILTSSNIDNISVNALKQFETCSSGFDYVACHYTAILSVDRHPNHVGQHFFAPSSGAQTPHFALDEYELYLAAKKAGSASAPSNAYHGADGLGAVPWLYLVSNGESYTKGLQSVYRVETAGGVAPSSCCSSHAGQFSSIPYAAQYWFYN